MILIQSNAYDTSTNDILDWLYYFNAKDVKRINNNSVQNKSSLRINNQEISPKIVTANGGQPITHIDSYWYRRGYFTIDLSTNLDQDLKGSSSFLRKEYENYIDALTRSLRQGKHINALQDCSNKAIQMIEASLLNIDIPDSIITGDPQELKAFAMEHRVIISKSLNQSRFEMPVTENTLINIAADTSIFSLADIEATLENDQGTFLPALFQQYIAKKYELRIFYLNGEYYTMAIFSQANEQTKIDFRNYDRNRPNRCVSYQLPATVEKKLTALMKKLNMNCGSIDMVYTPSGAYVFLEVNPIGQFQWLSKNCNYYIEEKIAQYLIHGQANN